MRFNIERAEDGTPRMYVGDFLRNREDVFVGAQEDRTVKPPRPYTLYFSVTKEHAPGAIKFIEVAWDPCWNPQYMEINGPKESKAALQVHTEKIMNQLQYLEEMDEDMIRQLDEEYEKLDNGPSWLKWFAEARAWKQERFRQIGLRAGRSARAAERRRQNAENRARNAQNQRMDAENQGMDAEDAEVPAGGAEQEEDPGYDSGNGENLNPNDDFVRDRSRSSHRSSDAYPMPPPPLPPNRSSTAPSRASSRLPFRNPFMSMSPGPQRSYGRHTSRTPSTGPGHDHGIIDISDDNDLPTVTSANDYIRDARRPTKRSRRGSDESRTSTQKKVKVEPQDGVADTIFPDSDEENEDTGADPEPWDWNNGLDPEEALRAALRASQVPEQRHQDSQNASRGEQQEDEQSEVERFVNDFAEAIHRSQQPEHNDQLPTGGDNNEVHRRFSEPGPPNRVSRMSTQPSSDNVRPTVPTLTRQSLPLSTPPTQNASG